MNINSSFQSNISNKDKFGFEIWFAVIIDRVKQKAAWVRYSKFFPKNTKKYSPTSMLWGSFYDSNNNDNHFYHSKTFENDIFERKENKYLLEENIVGTNKFTGILQNDKGIMEWDFDLENIFPPLKYTSSFMENIGIAKTKAVICSPFGKAKGNVTLNHEKHDFKDADMVYTHIWGKEYIDKLFWIYVPGFDSYMEDLSIELVSVKPKKTLPYLTFTIIKHEGKIYHSNIFEALKGNVKEGYPNIEFTVKVKDYLVKAKCKLNLEQNTRYIYKDPDGTNRYICHSDSSEVVIQIQKNSYNKLLVCKNTAAVEFHNSEKWDEEEYLDPFKIVRIKRI